MKLIQIIWKGMLSLFDSAPSDPLFFLLINNFALFVLFRNQSKTKQWTATGVPDPGEVGSEVLAPGLTKSGWPSKRLVFSKGFLHLLIYVESPDNGREQTRISVTGIAKRLRTLPFVFIYLFKWKASNFNGHLCVANTNVLLWPGLSSKFGFLYIVRCQLEFLMGGLFHSFPKYRIRRSKLSVLWLFFIHKWRSAL